MKLHLKIINLEGIFLEKDVDFLNVNTTSGELTILANHQPLITNINISTLYYGEDGVNTFFAIAGGTLFIDEKECKIITSAIEDKDSIDVERANNSKNRASQRLSEKDNPNIDFARAEASLKRALNRINLTHK